MTSNSMEDKANVIILHGPQASTNDIPATKRPGQLFAVHAMESEKYYTQMAPDSALWDKVGPGAWLAWGLAGLLAGALALAAPHGSPHCLQECRLWQGPC
jgi:hypothetical protein